MWAFVGTGRENISTYNKRKKERKDVVGALIPNHVDLKYTHCTRVK